MAEFASKGVANTGLGFGIAGTAIRDHPRLRGEQNLHGRKSQIRLL